MHRERERPVGCCICHESTNLSTDSQALNPRIHRSTSPLSKAFTNFTRSTNPQVNRPAYPRVHESWPHESTNLSTDPQAFAFGTPCTGKGKTCGVLHLSRIHESIHGFTSLQSTNPQIYESINPRIHKSMSKSSYLGVPPTPHCVLPTAFCTLYQGTRLALWCFASVKCFVVWLTFS